MLGMRGSVCQGLWFFSLEAALSRVSSEAGAKTCFHGLKHVNIFIRTDFVTLCWSYSICAQQLVMISLMHAI